MWPRTSVRAAAAVRAAVARGAGVDGTARASTRAAAHAHLTEPKASTQGPGAVAAATTTATTTTATTTTTTTTTRTTTTADGTVTVSTLPNGLRVCSSAGAGTVAAVGVLIDAGSRYETADNNGVSHLLDRLAFKSTETRTLDEMSTAIGTLGGNVSCLTGRETIQYLAVVFPHHVPLALDLLADTLLRPKLTPEELEAEKTTVQYELHELAGKPDALIVELAHRAAFGRSTLGLPVACPEENLPRLTVDVLQDFRARFYHPSRMIVAGAGVGHDVLLRLAQERFDSDFGKFKQRKAPRVVRTPAVYMGGECRVDAPQHELVHLGLFYEGVPFTHPDLYAIATLQMLLGGGSSFSSGGPGKGMYSRLYTNVLNQHGWVESIQAQMYAYADTALFGFTGTTEAVNALSLLHIFATELRRLRAPVLPIELSRAKNQLKASMFMHLESRPVQFEDISRQLLGLGSVLAPAKAGALIDAVTADDITRAVERLLATPPSLAVLGDCSNAPTLRDFVRP